MKWSLKKISIIVISILILVSLIFIVKAALFIQASLSCTTIDAGWGVLYDSDTRIWAQNFTSDITGNLTKLQLYLKNISPSVSGNFFITTIGSDNWPNVSNNISNIVTIAVNTTGSWYDVTFAQPVEIINNSNYAVVGNTSTADRGDVYWNKFDNHENCITVGTSVSSNSGTWEKKNGDLLVRFFFNDTSYPNTTSTAIINDSSSYTFGDLANSSYVNVTLSCSDDTFGSGCSNTRYCLDSINTCNPSTEYLTPIKITSVGVSYIRYYSVDVAGNTEPTQSQTLDINDVPFFNQSLTAQTIRHDQNLAYQANCTDNHTLTYYVNNTLVSINSSNGNITDNPAQNEEGSYDLLVTCGDGFYNTTETFTYSITNAAPDATSATINDSTPIETDDLLCENGTVSDLESDTVTLIFDWEKDGVWQSIDNEVLAAGNTTNGEDWRCRITPNDGFENGTIRYSQTVIIGSSQVAPTISDYNVTTKDDGVISNETNPTDDNEWLNFTVNVTDPNDNEWTLYICNSSSATSAGCDDFTYCNTSANLSTKLLTCRFDLNTSYSNNYTYFSFVVDNSSLISAAAENTFTVNNWPNTATLHSPANTTYHNTTFIYLNYTATDPNFDSVNYTIYNHTDPGFSVPSILLDNATTPFNWTGLVDGPKYIEIYTTDEHNYYDPTGSVDRFMFTVDTTWPLLSVSSPLNNETYTTSTVTLTVNANDTNIDVCNYTQLYKDTGIERSSGSVSCTGSTTVGSPFYAGGYTLNVYAYDLAGNYNTTQINYTTEAESSEGGGGGSDTTEEVTEIVAELPICGNGICQDRENPLTCPEDCPLNVDELLCFIGTRDEPCSAWVFSALVFLIIGGTIYVAYKRN